MKKTEIIVAALGLIAIVLSLFLVPFGAMLTVFTLSILGFIHLFFGFALYNGIRFRHVFKKQAWEGISALKIMGGIVSGWAVGAIVLGILYKILMWPRPQEMLQSGFFLLAVVLLVGLIKKRKSTAVIYRNTFKRLAIYGFVGLSVFIIPMNTLIDFKYSDYPSFAEARKNLLKDPTNQELIKIENEARLKMTTDMLGIN